MLGKNLEYNIKRLPMFQLGFVSAILADKCFEEVIDFAAYYHFNCAELMCWPKGVAERRYAGVTHIDVDALDADYTMCYLKEKNVFISALGYYPNPLDADEEKHTFYINHLKKVITAAGLLNIPVVNTFIGRSQHQNLEQNIALFKQYWPPIIEHARKNNVKIGIENCPMFFTADEGPNGKNIATSPAIWRQLFTIAGSDFIGLNYDPSHFIWQQMDYLLPLKEFGHKLFHIHLKDAKVYPEKLKQVGIIATPLEYHSPKLPGYGDINWAAFFAALKKAGYKGPVVIEFEVKEFETSSELVTKGLIETRDYIKQFL